MATYRTCVADANTQKQELEDTKVNSLRQIHELIKQTDQVIKSVSGAVPRCPQGRRWLCPAPEGSELVWVEAKLPSPSRSEKSLLCAPDFPPYLQLLPCRPPELTSVPLHVTFRPPSPSTS